MAETRMRNLQKLMVAWRTWLAQSRWWDLFDDGRLANPDPAANSGAVRDFSRRTEARAWLHEGRGLLDALEHNLKKTERWSVQFAVEDMIDRLEELEKLASSMGDHETLGVGHLTEALELAENVCSEFKKRPRQEGKRKRLRRRAAAV